MRLSRRQGLQLMLGAAQAVFLGAAGCATAGYVKIVTGRSGGAPLAYWRCSDAGTLVDEQAGGRDGAFTGTPSLVNGLLADSDQALSFPGEAYGEVADDAGLHLATFSVSGWLEVNSAPTAKIAVWSKDLGGLNDGDFALTIDENLTLGAQFQDASAQHAITTSIGLNTAHHWTVIAGGFGFDFFVDGQHIGRSTAFTNGWTNNTNPIQFAKAPWTGEEFVGILDEVALYDYALTDADVVALSQVTSVPEAVSDSAVVTESQTEVIDVTATDIFVGRKENLTVEVWDGASWGASAVTTHGTATVNASNDIDFAADAVTQDEADSFDYRISDVNGTSAAATVSVTVQDSADEGTLIYEWQPKASWIDGVPLSSRDLNDAGNISRWDDSPDSGANVGGSLVQGFEHFVGNVAFNRAPDGSPSIEVHCDPNKTGAQIQAALRFWNHPDVNAPRHFRIVMEIKTCKSSDPTTHKGNGLGTTGGSYSNWIDTTNSDGSVQTTPSNVGVKYFCGGWSGDLPAGGGGDRNWWNNTDSRLNRHSYRPTSGSSSKILNTYAYVYDRPKSTGGGMNSDEPPDGYTVLPDSLTAIPEGFTIADSGIHGVWHRMELEGKLTTPSTVPDNAVLQDPTVEPDHTGDGFMKLFCTKDIDGELGTPGDRTKIRETVGLIAFCKENDLGDDDNLHQDMRFTGPWIMLYYGGGSPANVPQIEGWTWIRKIQVYRLD